MASTGLCLPSLFIDLNYPSAYRSGLSDWFHEQECVYMHLQEGIHFRREVVHLSLSVELQLKARQRPAFDMTTPMDGELPWPTYA